MRRRWHLTRVGAVILVLLIACILVFCFASGGARVLAGAFGCLLLLMIGGEGLGAGTSASDTARKEEVLRRQARPRRRRRWRR